MTTSDSKPKRDPRGNQGDHQDCYHDIDPRVNKDLATALKGQNVMVTGGGRGLGRSIALFLTHANCASITLVALEQDEVDETAELCRAINPDLKTKAVALNVTDVDAVSALFQDVESMFNEVDVLIGNAGRPPQFLNTDETDPHIYWDTVSVSLQHSYLFTRAALRGMRARKRGCIVYTSSMGAHITVPMMGSYTIGKLGMVKLAELIHAESYEEFGIRCFAYHPGTLKTRFFTDYEDAATGQSAANGSYVNQGVEGEDRSVKAVYESMKNAPWDTTEMGAGLVTVLAAGKLDFMSGRFIDASIDINDYIRLKDKIVREDLYRVRMHVDSETFLPRLEF